jgi:hypothetical protein
VNESIVEGGKNVSNTKDKFTLSDLRAKRYGGFFSYDFLLGRLSQIVFSTLHLLEETKCTGSSTWLASNPTGLQTKCHSCFAHQKEKVQTIIS